MTSGRLWLESSEQPRVTIEVHSLRELLQNPELTRPPAPVIPRIAFEGRTTLFAAREKEGKTTFMADAAARYSSGLSVLGESVGRGQVLWLTEEALGDTVRRFQRVGADHDWLDVGVLPYEGRPIDRINALRERVESDTPDLIVIDTLSALLLGLSSNNDSAEVSTVMLPLCAIAHECGCSMVILHHASKAGGGYRGSTEFGARVDVIAEMTQGTLTYQRKISTRGRFGRDDFSVSYDGQTFELTQTGEVSIDTRVREWVIHNPGSTQNAIENGVGGNREHVRQAISALVASGRLQHDVEQRGRRTTHRYSVPGLHTRANDRANAGPTSAEE